MTSAAAVHWQKQRSLAEVLPAPLPLLFGAVVAWDILHVGSFEVAGSTLAPETIALGVLTACALMRAALHRTSRELAAQHVWPLAKVFAVFWGCIALVWLVHGADAESAGTFLRLPVFLMYAASTGLVCQRRQDVPPCCRDCPPPTCRAARSAGATSTRWRTPSAWASASATAC
jgi:hypothetical protein